MQTCIACGKSLNHNVTIIEGIGPVCRTPLLLNAEMTSSKLCDYKVEFWDAERIIIIHECYNPQHPDISLTNCIEQVINQVVKEYGVCTSLWTFVEHACYKPGLSGGYDEYDWVDIWGSKVDWRYLWHSDAPNETQPLTKELLIERVILYKRKAE